MSFLFGADTSPDAEAFLIKRYRQMTALHKLRQLEDLNECVQQVALSRLQAQYPDATERENRLRLGALWLGDELMKEVYGWDPVVQGR